MDEELRTSDEEHADGSRDCAKRVCRSLTRLLQVSHRGKAVFFVGRDVTKRPGDGPLPLNERGHIAQRIALLLRDYFQLIEIASHLAQLQQRRAGQVFRRDII